MSAAQTGRRKPLPTAHSKTLDGTTASDRLGRVASESWHAVERLIKDSMIRSLEALNLSRGGEVARLSAQVFDLERRLRDTRTRARTQLAASRAEQQKQMAEETRLRSLALIGQMVPALAHDLNTPIANSLLVVGSLNERLAAFRRLVDSGELRRSDLNSFVTELADGLAILTSTSAQAGELSDGLKHLAIDVASLRRREFALADVVDNVVRTLKPSLRQAQLNIECVSSESFTMDSYPGAIGQVLTNLMQNALVHAFDPAIAGARVRIETERNGRRAVRISVSDNGHGMSRAVRDQIFTPYFTTAGHRGGSGVGLHGVKQLVEGTLGGSITVRSRSRRGSCFIVELPLVAPPAKVRT